MQPIIQVETRLNGINFVSTGFDSFTFLQELSSKFENCDPLAIGNASDRAQFETSIMLTGASEHLRPADMTKHAEDQMVSNMINASPISMRWLLIRVDEENALRTQKKIRDLFEMLETYLTFDLPDFQPSLRWFAIGFPANDPKELSPEMMNRIGQLLVYWINSFTSEQPLVKKGKVKLTPREHEVLRWASEGKTSQEISTILGISPKTVNLHADNSINKLNAANRTNAVVRAIRLGLI
ncbi:MAG: helix-turn-helix transcriptional regulator [Rhizobiaceae bacterium]|nr:helix-turn-helix transcriptional regulator [Rhizobiaceae bacterium]